MRIGTKPGGSSLADLTAAWAAAESARFDLISRWDHISSRSFDGLDSVSVLGVAAARTRSTKIAFHVLNVALRNPTILASQLLAIQASSERRLEVGLGAGGSTAFIRGDHEMTGIPIAPFIARVRRLEAFCRVLPRLWRGEEVSDQELGIERASLGQLNVDPPPIIVGGMSESVLQVAARQADGWNASVRNLRRDRRIDLSLVKKFAEVSRKVDEIRGEVGRADPFDKQVQLLLTTEDLPSLREILLGFEEAGAGTAILVGPLDEPNGVQGVHRIAEAVL